MLENLTLWTAWLAMAGLAVSAVAAVRRGSAPGARWFWTGACAFLWMHVACAFQFEHHWSHAAAYEHTARRTVEFIGLEWGGGLYFNYVVMLVWAVDAGWWWGSPQSYRNRKVAIDWFVYGFVTFMAFNATVVFGRGGLRWLALTVTVALGVWTIRCRRGRRHPRRT